MGVASSHDSAVAANPAVAAGAAMAESAAALNKSAHRGWKPLPQKITQLQWKVTTCAIIIALQPKGLTHYALSRLSRIS